MSHIPHQYKKCGWIWRDEEGGSFQAKGNKVSSTVEWEFKALILAMQFLWMMVSKKVIMEGDCKELVSLFNNTINFGLFN